MLRAEQVRSPMSSGRTTTDGAPSVVSVTRRLGRIVSGALTTVVYTGPAV
jgi:hypothetical protein